MIESVSELLERRDCANGVNTVEYGILKALGQKAQGFRQTRISYTKERQHAFFASMPHILTYSGTQGKQHPYHAFDCSTMMLTPVGQTEIAMGCLELFSRASCPLSRTE